MGLLFSFIIADFAIVVNIFFLVRGIHFRQMRLGFALFFPSDLHSPTSLPGKPT
jgi:hypothetical protein